MFSNYKRTEFTLKYKNSIEKSKYWICFVCCRLKNWYNLSVMSQFWLTDNISELIYQLYISNQKVCCCCCKSVSDPSSGADWSVGTQELKMKECIPWVGGEERGSKEFHLGQLNFFLWVLAESWRVTASLVWLSETFHSFHLTALNSASNDVISLNVLVAHLNQHTDYM